jgi:transcriptional regulator GlxA family with amidase domain
METRPHNPASQVELPRPPASETQPSNLPLPNALQGAAPGQRWSGLAPHRLKRVLACIDLRLAEPIQVCELAEEVHMSPFHFTRMFKLATGHSPHKYITLQRVERAKQLLATSDMAIAAIAAAVGYQTQAHFTGVFARHAGTTPKVFRVAQRAGSALRPQAPAQSTQPRLCQD